MKYIVVAHKKVGRESCIVFDEQVTHLHVAQGVRRTHETISAGFCYLEVKLGSWRVEGRSESLKLDSRPIDAVLLTAMLTHGLSGLDLDNLMTMAELGQWDTMKQMLEAKGVAKIAKEG